MLGLSDYARSFFHAVDKEKTSRTRAVTKYETTVNMKRKFYLLGALVLPVSCLLIFSGCSSMDPPAKNDTAAPDRTGYYLDGHAEGE